MGSVPDGVGVRVVQAGGEVAAAGHVLRLNVAGYGALRKVIAPVEADIESEGIGQALGVDATRVEDATTQGGAGRTIVRSGRLAGNVPRLHRAAQEARWAGSDLTRAEDEGPRMTYVVAGGGSPPR